MTTSRTDQVKKKMSRSLGLRRQVKPNMYNFTQLIDIAGPVVFASMEKEKEKDNFDWAGLMVGEKEPRPYQVISFNTLPQLTQCLSGGMLR
jgi:hypothetical protein